MKKFLFICFGLFAMVFLLAPPTVGIAAQAIANNSGEILLATAPVTFFRDEDVYQKIKALLRNKLGIDPGSSVIAPSFLKSILAIDNAKSQYKFALKSGESVVSALIEQRLDRNDIFIAHRMGYGILPVVSANFGKAKLMTYPNQTVFPAVTTAGSEFTPDDLNIFWNAALTLKVGNTVFIPNFDTSQFYYGPETQKSSATNYDQADGANDGFVDLSPQTILSGESNIELNVNIPAFSGMKVDNTNTNTDNYLAVIYRGYVIKEANATLRNAFREYLK